MNKMEIVEIVEAQMKAADEAGENWADFVEGDFDGLHFFCDRSVKGWENGNYIVSVADGSEVGDVWVNGDSYSVDIR